MASREFHPEQNLSHRRVLEYLERDYPEHTDAYWIFVVSMGLIRSHREGRNAEFYQVSVFSFWHVVANFVQRHVSPILLFLPDKQWYFLI